MRTRVLRSHEVIQKGDRWEWVAHNPKAGSLQDGAVFESDVGRAVRDVLMRRRGPAIRFRRGYNKRTGDGE